MPRSEEWTADDVQRRFANPFYAIELAPMLVAPHDPLVTEEEWIEVNARAIKDMGAEAWLALLLDVLKGNYA